MPVSGSASGPSPAPADPGPATRPDRRRPGRTHDVSPELLPLLRARDLLEAAAERQPPPWNDLAPVNGIAVSVLLSIPLWAGIGLAFAWL